MNPVQKCILDIYKEFVKICEDNDLQYFAIGGTCIGSARHEGFIPWDDDMDIGMPIEDFIIFQKIAAQNLPNHLTLMSPENKKHDYLNFIKIMDSRTTMTEKKFKYWPDTYEGVWLDIMPLPGIPNPGAQRDSYLRRIRFYKSGNYKLRTPIDMQGSSAGKALWSVISLIKPFTSYDYYWRKFVQYIGAHPLSGSQYTGYVWSERVKRLIFPSIWFNSYIDMPFEDTTVRMPGGWQEMLTQMYGNYMELPPKEQQNSNHGIDEEMFSLSKSYLKYQEESQR